MPSPFATPDDVTAAWRVLTAEEEASAEFLLEYASEIVRGEFATIDDRVTAGTLSAVLVKGVVVAMVLRQLKNPEGWRSEQEAIEDYSTTKTRDSALSTGDIYMTDNERRILSRRGSGAFSITPHQEPATCAMNGRIAAHRAWRDR